MRSIPIATGEYYHIFNRGVDKRTVFEDDRDFRRFYEYLYLFNDENYDNRRGDVALNDGLLAAQEVLPDDRAKFVDIVSYCLRGNHFHLFLRQNVDGGISAFLHRLGMAYTKWFNRNRDRSGSLFESTYHAVHVNRDAHALHLPRYIHLNALDLVFPSWRSGELGDWDAAMKILDGYPWSSHQFYSGEAQELPILSEGAVKDISQDPVLYRNFLQEWTSRNLHPALWSLRDHGGL